MGAIPGDSFTFGTINSLETWGIKVIAYDVFVAPKRNNHQYIPFRHGTYRSPGARYYDEKLIQLDCCTETRELSKSDMRELIYQMSQRNRLVLWDEPDKYYIGELFDSSAISVLPKRIKQQFVLPIICEPFAFKDQKIVPLTQGINQISYLGTAETPTFIVLKNPNNFPISKIVVTAVRQKKQ